MDHPVVAAVREFVDLEVCPVAAALEHADAYPHALVSRMRELGLFGALVPEAFGGLGLGVTAYARVASRELLGGVPGGGDVHEAAARSIARLGVAATALGLAQAAFEAALRYSQQRTTFGKPIAQHQAIQLTLADMATRITAARLLAYDAAGGDQIDDVCIAMAKVYASETAYAVTLDSMRVHGGYGYTSEFPVERYYRDAARLASSPMPNTVERRELARALTATSRAAGARETRGGWPSGARPNP